MTGRIVGLSMREFNATPGLDRERELRLADFRERLDRLADDATSTLTFLQSDPLSPIRCTFQSNH
jgi:hypothetical protein